MKSPGTPGFSGDDPLLPLVLFEKGFSIDWAVELMGLKVSDTLAIIEKGISEGLLLQKQSGHYEIDAEKRKAALALMNEGQKEAWHRRIVDLLLREVPDDKKRP